MALDEGSLTDAALLLEALGQILLEDLPALPKTEAVEREAVARTCMQAAQQVVTASGISRDDHAAAQSYAGGEWHRALLRSLLGYEGAENALDHAN